MATYTELQDLLGNPTITPLRKKIRFALAVRARLIAADGASTPAQEAWAIECLRAPEAFEDIALRFICAEFRTQTVATIQNATDEQVQSAVDMVVNTLLGA